MTDTTKRDIAGIQYLRGIAAALVVAFHLSMQLDTMFQGNPAVTNLQSGVDIFFVISGFVMVYSTGAGSSITPELFIRKRIARVAPLYWAATLGMAAILLTVPAVVKSSKFGYAHSMASLLFIGAPNPANGQYIPLVTPGWTLNLEMFFYAVFAFAMWLARGNEGRTLAYASVLLVIASICGFFVRAHGLVGFYTNPVLVEFVFGMLLGQLFRYAPIKPSALYTVIGIVALLAMLLGPTAPSIYYRAARFGIAATIIVGAGVFGTLPRLRALHRLGDISYSLYLSHFFVASALAQVWRRLPGGKSPASVPAFYLCGMTIAILVAYIIWRWVETPLTKWARSLLEPERQFRSTTAVEGRAR